MGSDSKRLAHDLLRLAARFGRASVQELAEDPHFAAALEPHGLDGFGVRVENLLGGRATVVLFKRIGAREVELARVDIEAGPVTLQ